MLAKLREPTTRSSANDGACARSRSRKRSYSSTATTTTAGLPCLTVCGLRRAASTTSLNRFLASWTDQVGCAIDNLVWTRDGRGLFCQVPSLLGSGLL